MKVIKKVEIIISEIKMSEENTEPKKRGRKKAEETKTEEVKKVTTPAKKAPAVKPPVKKAPAKKAPAKKAPVKKVEPPVEETVEIPVEDLIVDERPEMDIKRNDVSNISVMFLAFFIALFPALVYYLYY